MNSYLLPVYYYSATKATNVYSMLYMLYLLQFIYFTVSDALVSNSRNHKSIFYYAYIPQKSMISLENTSVAL